MWGETDFLLTGALDVHERMLCPCGCGQWSPECMDDATVGRWQPLVATCHARSALAEFEKDHRADLGAASLMGVRLLPVGESVVDPLAFDPSRAAAEYAAHMERLGLPVADEPPA